MFQHFSIIFPIRWEDAIHQSGWLATGTSLAVPALPGALCLRSLSTAGWSHPGCGRWGAGPLEGWEDENSHGRPGLFDVDVEQLLISYSHWLLAICWLDPFRFGQGFKSTEVGNEGEEPIPSNISNRG
jgi:hypothetical protein